LWPQGVDPEIFKPIDRIEARRSLQLRGGDFVIVYVGGIGGYYRPLELLKIVEKPSWDAKFREFDAIYRGSISQARSLNNNLRSRRRNIYNTVIASEIIREKVRA